ncbi:hypothetical protein [Rhizobium ruizarguesonis]|jgi:hypothetical protein|nr:hypothetical protein [Rhizobium ruizarguesonis]MBY5855588.1 hypothetical protein [Rhizobium leguminosarum]NEJ22654.1 hypothetical protein [Rhizobium leguminosarum]
MTDTEKQIDEKKGDDVLKRMLKTPPEPKIPAKPKPGKGGSNASNSKTR